MGYKAYESLINLQLMWQMKDMIGRMTGVRPSEEGNCKILFIRERVADSMEQQYGFQYPGEVLERYQERCGDSVQNLRALAIALADEKVFLEDGMFIGNQKAIFISRIRARAEGDIYLKAALYVLTAGKEERERLSKELRQYEAQDAQEFFYLQSILDNDMQGDELEKYAYFLGEGRTFKVYGNEWMFSWFVEYTQCLRSKGKKKIPSVMRSLEWMTFHQIKENSAYWENMINAGYSSQEILYLNVKLPRISESDDALDINAITYERIVAHACEEVLNADLVESPVWYQEIARWLFCYHKFDIRIEGYAGLPDLLRGRVFIKDVDLFMDFYKRKDDTTIFYEWFWVNLLDDKWDRLASSMEAEEYLEFFETCMYFCERDNGIEWVEKYEKLCGNSYLLRFWTEGGGYTSHIFRYLVKEGVIDIAALIICYAQEQKVLDRQALDDKWSHMLGYMAESVCKLDSPKIFRFWDVFDRLFGMDALREFTKDQRMVSEAVGFRPRYHNSWYYSIGSDYWAKLDFLTQEEQRKLFYWAEDEIYLHMPEQYQLFLLDFLEKKADELFPRGWCSEMAHMLLEKMNLASGDASRIRTRFYEEDELERFEKEELIRKAEEEKRRKEKWREEWRQELYKGAETEEASLGLLGKNFNKYSSQIDYYEMVYSCILKEMGNGNCKIECEKLSGLLCAMGSIAEKKVSGWGDICRLINRLEVVEDGSGKDKKED